MVFVTLGGEASYTARRHPRAHKVVMSRGKVCEGPLRLRKEKNQELSGVGRAVERDMAWSWFFRDHELVILNFGK